MHNTFHIGETIKLQRTVSKEGNSSEHSTPTTWQLLEPVFHISHMKFFTTSVPNQPHGNHHNQCSMATNHIKITTTSVSNQPHGNHHNQCSKPATRRSPQPVLHTNCMAITTTSVPNQPHGDHHNQCSKTSHMAITTTSVPCQPHGNHHNQCSMPTTWQSSQPVFHTNTKLKVYQIYKLLLCSCF